MFRHLSFRYKFLNTLKNIDVEINVLFVVFFAYFCVAFHGYSKDICFHKLWLGLTRLMESTTSEIRTDL